MRVPRRDQRRDDRAPGRARRWRRPRAVAPPRRASRRCSPASVAIGGVRRAPSAITRAEARIPAPARRSSPSSACCRPGGPISRKPSARCISRTRWSIAASLSASADAVAAVRDRARDRGERAARLGDALVQVAPLVARPQERGHQRRAHHRDDPSGDARRNRLRVRRHHRRPPRRRGSPRCCRARTDRPAPSRTGTPSPTASITSTAGHSVCDSAVPTIDQHGADQAEHQVRGEPRSTRPHEVGHRQRRERRRTPPRARTAHRAARAGRTRTGAAATIATRSARCKMEPSGSCR